MTDPTGVLDLVRERVDNIKYSDSLQDWHNLVHLLPPLVEFADAAQKRAGAWPDKLAAEGYVFEHVPSSDPQVKKDHPFEHLAFWLYTDLARIANEAEQALAGLQEQLQEKADA